MTITINDELANYYFGERPWDPIDRYVFKESFKNRLAGYTYLVKAKFSNGITASDVFTVAEQSEFDKAVEAGKNAKALVSELARGQVSTSEGVSVLITSGKVLTKIGVKAIGKTLWGIGNLFLAICDIHDWLFAPTPDTGYDNNNVVGG